MPSVHKTVLLPYSAQQMYTLVHDVEHYPAFLPWCSEAVVHERSEQQVIATLGIHFKGIRQAFSTQNDLHFPHRIGIQLRDGPFSSLEGHWLFHGLRHDACKVDFRLDYSFKSGLLGQTLVPIFDHIARTFVDAFVRRAEQVYPAPAG